jgi:hypothetical protein
MDTPKPNQPIESTCERLGDLAAATSPGEPRSPDARGWAHLQAELDRLARPGLLRRRWPVVAAAVVVLLTLSGWLLAGRTLSFRAEGCAVTADGRYHSVGTGRIVFEEGSLIKLLPGASLRVEPLAFSRGAAVAIEDGQVGLSVAHGRGTEWTVKAGPFRVEVTGTRFGVAWERSAGRFRIVMFEGETVVGGGPIPAQTVLRAGQALRADARDFTVERAETGPPRQVVPSVSLPSAPSAVPPTAPSSVAARPAATSSGSARDLARASSGVERPHARRAVTASVAPTAPPQPAQPPTRSDGVAPASAGTLHPALELVPRTAGPTVAVADEPPHPHGGPWHIRIGADGRLSAGLSGAAWLAAGEGATLSRSVGRGSMVPLQAEDGQLCAHGRLAAWSCVNEGTPHIRCNWDRNWGVSIGFFVRDDKHAWGELAKSGIALDFQGRSAVYRLNAHRHGDPNERVVCVENYKSGQVVKASDFKSRCWDDAGEVLTDFASVDWFNLQYPSGMDYVAFHYCVSGVTLYP